MPSNPDVQHLSEMTVTHGDVYETSYTDRPTGRLTAMGENLKAQNPHLLSLLVQEGQAAAHERAPSLYPKCSPPNWLDLHAARRVGRDLILPDDQPAAVKPTPSKPATPSTADLAKLFGPGSDAGATNKMSREKPEEYARLRAAAVEAGLVRPTRTQSVAAHRQQLGFA